MVQFGRLAAITAAMVGISALGAPRAASQDKPPAEAGPNPVKPATPAKPAPGLAKKLHIDLRAGFTFLPPEGWQGVPAPTKGLGQGGADMNSTGGKVYAATWYDWEAIGPWNTVIILWNSDWSGRLDDAANEIESVIEKMYENRKSKLEFSAATKAGLSGLPAIRKGINEIMPSLTIKDAEARKKEEARLARRRTMGSYTVTVGGGRLFSVVSLWTGKTDAAYTGMADLMDKSTSTFKILSEGDRIGLAQKYGKGEVSCADWKVHETKHYRIEYNCDEEFAKKLGMHLESILAVYQSLWPIQKTLPKFRAKCCSSIDGYHKFGGPYGSAGYFSPYQKELVTYKDTNSTTFKSPETGEVFDVMVGEPGETTFHIMYHEAMHQFGALYCGENRPVPIPSWFGEGMGDYFFGGNLQKNGRIKIEENSWRVNTVKKAAKDGQLHPGAPFVKLKDLVKMDQGQYYSNPSVCYSEGWALCYYLLEIAPRKNPAMGRRYRQIPITMLEQLEKNGDPVKATAKAFEGIDLDALEKEWKEWIVNTLEMPAKFREAARRAEVDSDVMAVEDAQRIATKLAKTLSDAKGEAIAGTVGLVIRVTSEGKFRLTAQGKLTLEVKTLDIESAKAAVSEAVAAAGDPTKVAINLYSPMTAGGGGGSQASVAEEIMKIMKDINDFEAHCAKLKIEEIERLSKSLARWRALTDEDEE